MITRVSMKFYMTLGRALIMVMVRSRPRNVQLGSGKGRAAWVCHPVRRASGRIDIATVIGIRFLMCSGMGEAAMGRDGLAANRG